jgi:DNA-binding NarL/FixJ family response regulator
VSTSEQAVTGNTRFVIVDVEPLIVEALISRVRAEVPSAEMIYAGCDLSQGLEAALVHGCDCALVDVEAREPSGSPVAKSPVASFAAHNIPVVAMANEPTHHTLESVTRAGARALIDKRQNPADITRACRSVLAGDVWFPDDAVPPGQLVVLSAQERRALILYASGLKQDSVARRMGIASSTVKHYLDRARFKYNAAGIPARTKLELHELVKSQGLIA